MPPRRQINLEHKKGKDTYIFYCFLILLVWIPLPLGSNRPWAWHLLEIAAFALALCWLALYVKRKVHISEALKNSTSLFIALGLFASIILLQTLPLPTSWVSQVRHLDKLTETHSFTTISIDAAITQLHLRKTLSFITLTFLLLALVNTKSRAKLFAATLLLSGVIQAVYGSLMTLSGLEYGFFMQKEGGFGTATGTFWNRNHYANYLILCLSMGTGLLLSDLYKRKAKNWKERSTRIIDTLLGPKLRIRVALALMVIALVLTRSRMGNTAFFVGLLISGILWLWLTKRVTRGSILLLISLILVDTLIVGKWFGIDKVKQRLESTVLIQTDREEPSIQTKASPEASFDQSGSIKQTPNIASTEQSELKNEQYRPPTTPHKLLPHEIRSKVNRDSLAMIKDQWLLGAGAGSNYTGFPVYRQGDYGGYFDHTHNDYLEFVAEHGLIGSILLALIVIMSLVNTIVTMVKRKSLFFQAMAFAPLMTIVAMLLHSTVEFNLQIPGIAITYLLILSYSWVLRYTPHKD